MGLAERGREEKGARVPAAPACGCDACEAKPAGADAPRRADPATGAEARAAAGEARAAVFARTVLGALGLLFGLVLAAVVVAERLGLLEAVTERVPAPLWAAAVAAGGFPVFRRVALALRRGRVTSHTLMTVGLLAAVAVGEWATAALVVFFMRVGEHLERFTAERARAAVRGLAAAFPRRARVERAGGEAEVPADQVRPGEVVVVRPGERVPVDGVVLEGWAAVDAAAVTGEPLPVEAGPGARLYAASLVRDGSLRLRAERVGAESSFGRVLRLVEEAAARKGEAQRLADRISAWALPVVVMWALLTFLVRRDPLATAAVLLVACSCSFALATPMAVLAAVGAGARRGVLIKGGEHLELLARADTFLLDKTGTLTLGRPRIVDVAALPGFAAERVLALAAAAERYSEHPLAEAIRAAARERGLAFPRPDAFERLPGLGVRARVDGLLVAVGSERLIPLGEAAALVERLRGEGRTVLAVAVDGRVAGFLAAADELRPEVPEALACLRAQGATAEVVTGDAGPAAQRVAAALGVPLHAGFLPDQKVELVRRRREAGRVVAMVGDGLNDAAALAAADVGIAVATGGNEVAVEAAPVVLLREDWRLIPWAVRLARRCAGVIRLNLVFTVAYNLIGMSLAAAGLLPPPMAAAAQSLPDVVMLLNSSRLLRG